VLLGRRVSLSSKISWGLSGVSLAFAFVPAGQEEL